KQALRRKRPWPRWMGVKHHPRHRRQGRSLCLKDPTMNLTKREFLQVLGAASAAGMGLGSYSHASAASAAEGLYDIPKFGKVSLLHMTDCHAQLKPIHFREPSVNLGLGDMKGRLPHLVGEHLLKAVGVKSGTPTAHALTYLDFDHAAERYGKVGG